jgi:hypothetical protein
MPPAPTDMHRCIDGDHKNCIGSPNVAGQLDKNQAIDTIDHNNKRDANNNFQQAENNSNLNNLNDKHKNTTVDAIAQSGNQVTSQRIETTTLVIPDALPQSVYNTKPVVSMTLTDDGWQINDSSFKHTQTASSSVFIPEFYTSYLESTSNWLSHNDNFSSNYDHSEAWSGNNHSTENTCSGYDY